MAIQEIADYAMEYLDAKGIPAEWVSENDENILISFNDSFLNLKHAADFRSIKYAIDYKITNAKNKDEHKKNMDGMKNNCDLGEFIGFFHGFALKSILQTFAFLAGMAVVFIAAS